MDKLSAITLIKDTLQNSFNKEQFLYFIKNLLNHVEETPTTIYRGNLIPDAYKSYIQMLERICKYRDPKGNKIDVLIIHLKKETSLEQARTMQRNFIALYLNGSRGGVLKDAAIVAFVSPDEEDWRFSFVKMEYKLTETTEGTFKAKEEFTPAKRYSFLVGKNENSHTAQSRLIPLLLDDEHNLSLKEIEDAFSIEKVTKEFFEKYRELFLRTKDALDEIVEKDIKIKDDFTKKGVDTVDFVKKLLGQIVFLYFLQKKGWFGVERDADWGTGPKNFLRILSEKKIADYKNFFNDILEPLFYEALASERTDDFYSRFNCKIPFLNGGLFDPINSYDWVHTDILLPNELFSNEIKTKERDIGTGILDVFDRYNFTVKEDEPLEKEVAVDPEMLGKVFENLLEVKDRKSKGTYYTPREIVHYMCQESLINYLDVTINSGKEYIVLPKAVQKKLIGDDDPEQLGMIEQKTIIPREDIESFIKYGVSAIEHDKRIESKGYETRDYSYKMPESIRLNARLFDDALKSVKICDPAIGSGAFPVAMMHEIVRARETLTTYLPALEKANINYPPLTKGGEGGFYDRERTPYHFKRHAIQNCLYGVDIDPGAVDIAKLRLWLSLVVDEDDFKSIKPLPNLDYKIVCGDSLSSVNILFHHAQLKKLEELKGRFFEETNSKKKSKLKEDIDHLIREITHDDKHFDFKVYFSEVFHQHGGFDLIIANPPYVKEYVNRKAFDSIRNSPFYQGKMDIWYLFACKGIDNIREKGLLTFIAQNNWVTSYGASKMRNKIISDTKILSLLDFGDYKIFETAGIQTMVMMFQRDKETDNYNFDYRRISGEKIVFEDILDLLNCRVNPANEYLTPKINRNKLINQILTFSSSEIDAVFKKMLSKSGFNLNETEVANGIHHHHDSVNKERQKILGDRFEVGDGIFVLSDKEKKNISFLKNELELLKPSYTTKELHKWHGNSKNKEWVIYTDSSFKAPKNIKPFPNIKAHLDKFKKVITSDNKPYGLHRARDEYFFKGEKIIAVRKCIEPTFTYTDFDCYVSATFYVIKSERINLKFLTAILNSKLIAFWLKHKGKMQGNNYQIDKEPLLAIPIYNPSSKDQQPFISLVDRILAITKDEDYLQNPDKQVRVKELERQIDQMVYKLYGLTEEEINIVENFNNRE